MMRVCHSLLFAGLAIAGMAQWEVPAKIVLDGPDGIDRQMTGLALPVAAEDGASVNADRNSTTAFAPVSGTEDLTATLTPAPTGYAPGMRLTLLPVSANDSGATLNVNGLGAVPLRKNINMPLDSGDLRPGIPVHVVHDGAVFQVTSQLYPGCPTGYAAANADVCIQMTPSDTINWYTAVIRCGNAGARLCGLQDWLQGCLSIPGFQATIVDYEWVDNAANSNTTAKLMGWSDTSTAGDCHLGSRQSPLTKFRARCCYDR